MRFSFSFSEFEHNFIECDAFSVAMCAYLCVKREAARGFR